MRIFYGNCYFIDIGDPVKVLACKNSDINKEIKLKNMIAMGIVYINKYNKYVYCGITEIKKMHQKNKIQISKKV